MLCCAVVDYSSSFARVLLSPASVGERKKLYHAVAMVRSVHSIEQEFLAPFITQLLVGAPRGFFSASLFSPLPLVSSLRFFPFNPIIFIKSRPRLMLPSSTTKADERAICYRNARRASTVHTSNHVISIQLIRNIIGAVKHFRIQAWRN